MPQIVFGPVPSRRLGQSIGINHIPPKICTYACRYCQLGKAIRMQTKREEFYDPEMIFEQVEEKIRNNNKIDFLTLVPDGEPSLDENLEEIIDGLKKYDIPVAVISNSSMLWDVNVRKALLKTDRISLKIDAANQEMWRKVDRPHRNLNFDKILEGILKFSSEYEGYLMTESMLIKGYNDSTEELKQIANFIEKVNPDISYIAIPTRPPADKKVLPADEKSLQTAWALFSEKVKKAELLIGYEGNEFSFTGDSKKDILSITAVHPMREDAVKELLEKNNDSFDLVKKLIDKKEILELEFGGKKFYLRKLRK